MRSLMFLLLLCLTSATLVAGEKANDPELSQLVQWMTGSFSSAEQAAADKDFYDIHLDMRPIWTDRTDGYWLYVEQAVSTSLDKPYRQRVYHVKRGENGVFESVVYALPNPEAVVNAQKKSDKPLSDLSPKDLKERVGCTVYLEKKGDTFAGSTREKECTSKLRGATYATSIITIRKGTVESWDQGFNDKDEQVWGAEKSGYIFKQVHGK